MSTNNSNKNQLDKHQHPANAYDRLKAARTPAPKVSLSYKDVSESTDFKQYSSLSQIKVFKEFNEAIYSKDSKEKKEHRNIITAMLDLIVNLNGKTKLQETEIKEFKEKVVNYSKNQQATAIGIDQEYGSYADCVNNKKKENLVIIKKQNIED